MQGVDENRDMAGFIFMDTLEMFIGPINAINISFQIRENLSSKKLKTSFKKAILMKLKYCTYSQ